MATSSTNAATALGDMTRFQEMRKRLWFLLGALVVYRVGTFIPVPGIDAAKFAAFFSGQQGTLLGMFNMFSGGALQRFSIFALNVMPYITASIIVQMASMVYAPWNADPQGRRVRPAQTDAVHALRHGGARRHSRVSAPRSRSRIPAAIWCRTPGPQFLFVATVSITTGTHVRDVAGRADHRARHRQRHHHDHRRRHRRGTAARHRQHAGNGALRRDEPADRTIDPRRGHRGHPVLRVHRDARSARSR